jgi:ABC-type polysaccharide/polyol phosphate export permease
VLGVLGGLVAENFDDLTVMNQFILRPLVFFGAVFYSLDVLPGIYQTLSLLNPMVYMTKLNLLYSIYTNHSLSSLFEGQKFTTRFRLEDGSSISLASSSERQNLGIR